MHCYSYYRKTGDSLLTQSILFKALYLSSFHCSLNVPNVTIPALINFFMRTIRIGFHLKQIEGLTWCHVPLLAVISFLCKIDVLAQYLFGISCQYLSGSLEPPFLQLIMTETVFGRDILVSFAHKVLPFLL